MSSDLELERLSDRILGEFHERQKTADSHHDPKMARIKLTEARKRVLRRERTLEKERTKEERLRQQNRFYEGFRLVERNGLVMLAPGSASEYILTDKGRQVRPDHVVVGRLEEKYRAMEARWNRQSVQTKIAGPAGLLALGSLFATLLTSTWTPSAEIQGSLSPLPSQWTPVFAVLFFGGFAVLMLTSSRPLTKEETIFARLYRAYRFVNEKRFKDAVDELDRVSKGLIFFMGPKTNWRTIDSDLRTLSRDLGNSIRSRLLPVVAGKGAASATSVLPDILVTAEAFAHPSPDAFRIANANLLRLDDRGPYKPPTKTEKWAASLTPTRFLLIGILSALALSIAVFSVLALAYGRPLLDYENAKLMGLGFLTMLGALLPLSVLFRR